MVGDLDAERAAQDVALRLKRRGGAVARQVAVLALDLLVRELVGEGETAEQLEDARLDLVALLDEALGGVLVDAELLEGALGRVADEPDQLLGLTGRDRVARHRRILLLPRFCGTPYGQLC